MKTIFFRCREILRTICQSVFGGVVIMGGLVAMLWSLDYIFKHFTWWQILLCFLGVWLGVWLLKPVLGWVVELYFTVVLWLIDGLLGFKKFSIRELIAEIFPEK